MVNLDNIWNRTWTIEGLHSGSFYAYYSNSENKPSNARLWFYLNEYCERFFLKEQDFKHLVNRKTFEYLQKFHECIMWNTQIIEIVSIQINNVL